MTQPDDNRLKISQAAELLGLEPYVLRFWETEFPQLRPERTPAGQRLYNEDDILLLRRIKHLLHTKGLTIQGARLRLEDRAENSEILAVVEEELMAIRDMLRQDGKDVG